MAEFFVRERTLSQAYHEALAVLWRQGDVIQTPDWNTRRIECSMTMCVEDPEREPMISKFVICGPHELEQYRQEMLDGILDFEIEKGNWAYTYHQRYTNQKYIESTDDKTEVHCIDQYKFVLDELRRNPFSTRAVMDLRALSDVGNEEPACWQHVQFMVRDGALECKTLFRSNDAVKATFMNAFAIIMLQKKLAKELGYAVGRYTHRANSFHAYERDWDKLQDFVERYIRMDEDEALDELTYLYKGDWDEMMKDEQPSIAALVESLKGDFA